MNTRFEVAMAEIVLDLLGVAGALSGPPKNQAIPYLAKLALIDAGFTMVYIMYGISDHSATESRLFRTRVLLLDMLRSKIEWDLWYHFMFNRNVFLCMLTLGFWIPKFRERTAVKYPGRINWRVDHPRPDGWVSPELVPDPDPAENILPLDEYLRLPDPTPAELQSCPEVETLRSALQTIPVRVEDNMISTHVPLLLYIDKKFNHILRNYNRSAKSPQDLAAFEARKLFLNKMRSRIEWEDWNMIRRQCTAYLCIFTAGLWTPCCIKVSKEEYPGFEAWRSKHPEPEYWRTK